MSNFPGSDDQVGGAIPLAEKSSLLERLCARTGLTVKVSPAVTQPDPALEAFAVQLDCAGRVFQHSIAVPRRWTRVLLEDSYPVTHEVLAVLFHALLHNQGDFVSWCALQYASSLRDEARLLTSYTGTVPSREGLEHCLGAHFRAFTVAAVIEGMVRRWDLHLWVLDGPDGAPTYGDLAERVTFEAARDKIQAMLNAPGCVPDVAHLHRLIEELAAWKNRVKAVGLRGGRKATYIPRREPGQFSWLYLGTPEQMASTTTALDLLLKDIHEALAGLALLVEGE